MSATGKPGLFDHPTQFLDMGRKLVASGKTGLADALVRKALEERPGNWLVRAIANRIASQAVPRFHAPMLHDLRRNQIYRRAIEAEAAGRTILDIGTGSGLLAMMAARAGALHVYACEQDERLAATARQIIATNGLTDRITVLAANSTALDPVRDLGDGVDMVISEIFAADLLSESLLPAMRDAQARLCLPGSKFLPASASVRVALFDMVEAPDSHDLNDVEGFDLGIFARHLKSRRRFDPDDRSIILRSAPADLFRFDFPGEHAGEDRASVRVASTGGRVCGALQWIGFDCASGHSYENAPAIDAPSHWAVIHHPLDQPVETAVGEAWEVSGWRNDSTVLCWPERAGG